ncbi:MAG: RNA polymerase sigma-70 factor [Bryobacteraceae bacterium]|nr:RNA polymerase sigma-70 factor [Bryobacteraceae bacterium]
MPGDAPFESQRGRLFGLAYRMLGSRADAEDIVQDTYLRWRQAERESIRNPEAWLVTAATRLSIDRLRAAKKVRETYSSPWLPEPLISEMPSPDRDAELASDLSIAFLTLLERLAPEERAAFLLHEAFDCGYDEIAGILGKTTAACRQIVHRARERVRSDQRRFRATDSAKERLLRQFTAAVEARDEKALLALFAPDATWAADGGGRVPAAPRPIVGAERIVRLVLGLQQRFYRDSSSFQMARINGEAGLCVRLDGRLIGTLSVETDGERILNVYVVVNPEKLGNAAPQ